MRIMNVVGARPNMVKIAALTAAMRETPGIELSLVHTGQHYDENMSDVFFRELDIPYPDVFLNVGSGSHARQTAAVMMAFEPALLEHRPDVVCVVGDVNSTIACALVAVKLGIRVAHVEAGLRSFDRTMPEEINRVLTDAIADYLFTPSEDGNANLLKENVDPGRIFLVGNVMIDTLLRYRERAVAAAPLGRWNLSQGNYALITLHRPSNVDEAAALRGLLDVLVSLQERLPVVFPVHPRTRCRIEEFGLDRMIADAPGLHLVDPLGYLEFLGLIAHSRIVLTDSGGIQEETTVLGVPCLTLRANTERPITVTHGTNTLVSGDPRHILEAVDLKLADGGGAHRVPPLWDGQAAQRIVDVLVRQKND